MKIDQEVQDWLLEPSQPAVRFHTLVELLDRPVGDPEVRESYSDIGKRGWAKDILAKQKTGGYWNSRKSLYRPKYTATNWKALVLSDLGLTSKDIRIKKLAELFFKDWLDASSEDNIFNDEVCIVGNTARMLTRFGYTNDRRVGKLFDRLIEDQKVDGGWHCFKSDVGTLDCWEALAAFAALPNSRQTRKIKESIQRGAEFYLDHKLCEEGRSRYKPWFRFHYPNHYYYDILVGLDVITSLGYSDDRRLSKALELMERKRRSDGKWNLDKIHPDPATYAWGKHNLRRKVIPFGLEKTGKPSKWITLTALKIQKRIQES